MVTLCNSRKAKVNPAKSLIERYEDSMRIIDLPERFARCQPPKPEPTRPPELPSEESATIWLWCWPRLLGWRHQITWLFSPVNDRRKYPGDVWGVDAIGNLLIVETKVDRHALQNPFEHFEKYACDKEIRELWCAERLEERWRKLHQLEREFFENKFPSFSSIKPPSDCYPGIVPYSYHRLDIAWRWRHLYSERLGPQVTNPRYERAARRALRCRKRMGNRPPIFFGLIATVRMREPSLSSLGTESAASLLKSELVGPERLFLRAVRPTSQRAELRIHCWSIPFGSKYHAIGDSHREK
jgi:hypothetical protein